ncbi:MAG TPA: DUF2270 domain-containing protein [Sandaracinaceae bacterium]
MSASSRHDRADDEVLVQLYRAFAGVESMWRQRLDVTSNWAVPLVLGLVTLALSEPSVPHLVLLVLGWALIVLAALVESRRYRLLHHAAWRTGLLEGGFFAPVLDRSTHPQGWRAALANDLRRPALRLSAWTSLRSRFRATYAVLGHLLTLAWIAKLVVHPALATSAREVLDRMATAHVVPGWAILVLALAALAAASAMALTGADAETLEARASEGAADDGAIAAPARRGSHRSIPPASGPARRRGA